MKNNILSAMAVLALVVGCGGGSGSGSGTSVSVSASAPVLTMTDPFTGKQIAGSPAKTIYAGTYPGATVTAYNVQPDGSNGAALSSSVVADSSGYVTMALVTAPTGVVRLVSTGGSYSTGSNLDSTTQKNTSLELVTPYVSTTLNGFFEISPLSHIASRVLASKAKNGSTLLEGFKAGMAATLNLDVAEFIYMDDLTVYFNMLRGSIKSDTRDFIGSDSPSEKELLSAIEWFGVQFDLPTSVVTRILAANAEGTYLTANDGSGRAINVGRWVNGVFDETVPFTLDEMMSADTTYANFARDKGGKIIRPRVSDYISSNLIMDFIVDSDCRSGTVSWVYGRYPYYAFETASNGNLRIPAAACAATGVRVKNLLAKTSTTNRYKAAHSGK